jgi:hypothetical protein
VPDLILKRTGQPQFVAPELLADALASQLYEVPAGDQKVAVQVRPGLTGEATIDSLASAQARGSGVESEQSFRGREREARLDREHGGVLGTIQTVGETALDEASLGAFGAVGEAIGGDEYTERRLERQEANPIAHGVTKVGTIVGTTLLTGGAGGAARIAAKTPLGMVTKLGARIGKAGEGASGLAKAGRLAAGGAIEGGLTGAGQGVQQLVATDDPLTVEQIASTIGSNVLAGTAMGAGGNLAAAGVGKALRTAKKGLDKVAANAAESGTVADDLAGLDRKGLRATREAEVETLVKAQQGERAAAVDDLVKYEKSVKDANPWAVINEGPSAAKFNATTKQIRKALDDVEGLGKSGASVLKPLRVQAGALQEAIENADALTAKLTATSKKMSRDLGEELATLPDKVTDVALDARMARRYADWADVKVKKGGVLNVSREEAQRFASALGSGEILGTGKQSLQKLSGLLEQNKALQARIETSLAAKTDLVSDRLKSIDDASDALASGGGPKSLVQQASQAGIFSVATGLASPLGMAAPLIGAKVSSFLTEKLFGQLGKGAGEAAKRASSAVSKFLEIGGKVAPSAPVLATKVLGGVRYAPSTEPKPVKGVPVRKAALPELFKTRTDEIRSQTAYGPDGRPVMRMSSREAIAKQLAPIAAVDPMLADKLESAAVRRIEFLAGKIPRRPDLGGIKAGPDRWQPSDMEMRAFARYVAAVEDPGAIAERLADGSITPEDAEAMREVYPEQYADLVRQILEKLPELQQTLPYSRRLALSIFSGVPVDASMDPHVLATLQASFTEEPGTEGGSQAPKAAPAFGSVKNQEATPSQERAGATT